LSGLILLTGGTMKKLLFILFLLGLSSSAFAQNKGVLLENLTWQEAEKALMLYMDPAAVDMRKPSRITDHFLKAAQG